MVCSIVYNNLCDYVLTHVYLCEAVYIATASGSVPLFKC